LEKYSWPGNVRELQNLVERLIVLTRESTITAQMLPPEISRSPEAPTSDDFAGLSFKEATRRFESQFIEAVIQKAGGNKSKAARMLGIHRNTLLQLEKKAKTSSAPETSEELN
jgi:DNA-binding NtrC family response regulator